MELSPPAARHPAGRGRGRDLDEDDLFGPDYLAYARCCGPSATRAPARWSCWWTRSTVPTTSSRRSCSSCWPSRPSPSPSWARCGPSCCRWSSSPPTAPATSTTRLQRRCLYHWIDYLDLDRAVAVIRRRSRRPPPPWPSRRRPSSGSAAWTCRSCRAWPRPSTGWPPWASSASTGSTPTRPTARSARSSSTARTSTWSASGAPSGWPGPVTAARVDRVDLAELTGAFGQLLHAAGVPVTPERSGRFATAVALVRPAGVDEWYWAGRVTLLAGRDDIETYDRVFGQVFRGLADVADWSGGRRRGLPPGHRCAPTRRGRTTRTTGRRSRGRAPPGPTRAQLPARRRGRGKRGARPAGGGQRRGAPPPHRPGRPDRGRARRPGRADGGPAAGHASAGQPPHGAGPRGRRLDVRHPAAGPGHRRRPRPPPVPAPDGAAPPPGPHRRRVRLDGPLRPGLPAPAARGGAGHPGRRLRVRHPADPADPPPAPHRPRPGPAAGAGGGARTGPAAPASPRRCGPSSTATAAGAWAAARWW